MFLTVHTTAAIVLTQRIANPWLAFLIGLLSHFVLDAIPHGDKDFVGADGRITTKKFFTLAIIDIAITVIWVGFLFGQNHYTHFYPALAAVIGSILPDFIMGIYLTTKNKLFRWGFNLNEKSHQIIKKNLTLNQGLILQFLIFLIFAWYLF